MIRLPDHPSLEKLRKLAKRLARQVHDGEPRALALVAELHPRPPAEFRLADAHLVTARLYGFASWPRLVEHLETVERYSRSPHTVPEAADPADEFLRRACLTYGADHPGRLESARSVAYEPTVHTMAATGSYDELRALLAREPGLAVAQGGPFGWEPLLYLCYARVGPGRHVDAARLLLEHGADPGAGFLWESLPSPFTALTGAFGGGEGDQPPHPAAFELAGLLLEHGADPNDAQTLYNNGLGGSWSDRTDILGLLLAHGLGRGDGGSWKRRLGHALAPPDQLIREELATAALRGGPRRARLLLEHGAQPDGIAAHPAFEERTPLELALLHGHHEVAEILREAGGSASLSTMEQFVASCMRGEDPRDPELTAHVRATHPGLINTAAGHRNVAAVRLLVRLGFDVDQLERATPLHEAAWNDDVEMARTLVELGADPSIEDREHGSTPLGWAQYGGKRRVLAYLASL
ncbi:ankyrin repeat domain-containing protein [Nonomuraea soli]|uniref:Ankyrin repeat protein n=1 Tax=Nonomuraea soli TaxID=1032476 RepID=A0A7W0CDM2_9ACTN|nr:ankyrin repeat domain-containing protein [Nonomuraea soli]MBA2889245.1 ankyrin repeat protein [Nonomuraea soli]